VTGDVEHVFPNSREEFNRLLRNTFVGIPDGARTFHPVEGYTPTVPPFAELRLAKSVVDVLKCLSDDGCPWSRAILRAYEQKDFRRSRLLNPDLLTKVGNFFAFRESEGLVTFCPPGREQKFNDDGTWKREGRQSVKPAKWLRAVLHPRIVAKLPDHIFGKFSEKFRALEQRDAITFREDVSFGEAYASDNYPDQADAINSCMWDQPVGGFYGLFPCHPVVIERGDGKFLARAILWTSVEGLDCPFLDRIYAVNPETTEAFLAHAKAQGWAVKARQSNGYLREVILPDGRQKSLDLRVAPASCGSFPRGTFFPYADTFRILTPEGELVNAAPDDDDPDYDGCSLLEHTNGGITLVEGADPHDGEVQDIDGYWISENDAVVIGGNIYSADDDRIVWSYPEDRYILRCDAVSVAGDWYSEDSTAILLNDAGEYVLAHEYV
jgi:hypothetical protein